MIGERGGSVARAADTESLRIGVQGASKRPGSVAYVMKELSASTSRVHVTFYMVAPEAIGKTQQPVVTFELPHDGKLTQVSLVLSDDGTRVKEREVLGDGGGAPTGYAVNTKLPSDGVNIDMTVSLGTTPKLEIDFNAVQVFSRNLASSLPRAPRLRVYFGTQEAEVPTGAWELRVDDIHITAE